MDYFKPAMFYKPLAGELIRQMSHIGGVYSARPSSSLVYHKGDFRSECWEWSIPNLPEASHVTGDAGQSLHRFSGVRPFNCSRLFKSPFCYVQVNLV